MQCVALPSARQIPGASPAAPNDCRHNQSAGRVAGPRWISLAPAAALSVHQWRRAGLPKGGHGKLTRISRFNRCASCAVAQMVGLPPSVPRPEVIGSTRDQDQNGVLPDKSP